MIYTILEGKQAEEYLQRKRDIKNDEIYDRDKYNRKRGGEKTVKYSYINIPKDGIITTSADYKNDNLSKSYERNPRYKTARELEQHRDKYGDLMPKKKSSSELDYEDIKYNSRNIHDKASKNIKKDIRYRTTNTKLPEDLQDILDDPDYSYRVNREYDARARHIRRHPEQYRESAFDSIEFI